MSARMTSKRSPVTSSGLSSGLAVLASANSALPSKKSSATAVWLPRTARWISIIRSGDAKLLFRARLALARTCGMGRLVRRACFGPGQGGSRHENGIQLAGGADQLGRLDADGALGQDALRARLFTLGGHCAGRGGLISQARISSAQRVPDCGAPSPERAPTSERLTLAPPSSVTNCSPTNGSTRN